MMAIFKYRKWIAAAGILAGAVLTIVRGLRGRPEREGYAYPGEEHWG